MAEIKKKYSIASERLEGESFEEYKKRRKLVKESINKYLKGSFVWYSKNPADLMMGKTDTSWGTMTPEKMDIVKDEIIKIKKEKENGSGK